MCLQLSAIKGNNGVILIFYKLLEEDDFEMCNFVFLIGIFQLFDMWCC